MTLSSLKIFWSNPWLRWGLVAIIQLIVIALPLSERLSVQMSGREATLAVRPVDPRDLLRGDYVIINLAISEIPSEIAASLGTVKRNETIYVGLTPDTSGVARVSSVSRSRDGAGELAIKGTVFSRSNDALRMNYGIDAFYVAEGTGKVIEQMDTSRVQLVVAISADGRSLPLRLLVDGKPFKSDDAF
ncbi:MAG: GDYXXLXY domain-containing protein [Rhodobacteraceae bacterium]|nr:GDYXXLXY domain-containing protein [Paracoccaceae bacterium]